MNAHENSIAAFRAALDAGATHLETDVHASCDGVAVLSHDPELPATAGRAGWVEQLSFAELAALDLGAGSGFASLAEAFEAFPSARFNIDVKSDAAVGPTIDAVLGAEAQSRVLIASFSERRRRRVAKALPGAATSASSRRIVPALLAAAIGATPLVRLLVRGLDAAQLPERHGGIRVLTRRTIRMLRAAGLEVDVWTVNDPDEMSRFLELGVDGIITDRSDRAVEIVNALR